MKVSNGEPLITDAISAPAESGAVELNGAAARLGMPARSRYYVLIMSYGQFHPEEVQSHRPTVVFVDQHNRIIEAQPNNKLN